MKTNKINSPRFLAYVLTAQAASIITLVLNIPFARQIIGFLFLTFIPGFLLLRIFRLDGRNLTETILFSVGLSIAFLMLIGLLTNELGSLSLLPKPLSTEPLAIVLNLTITLMCLLDYFTNREDSNPTRIWDFGSSRIILPCIILPILSVTGVLFDVIFNNNLLLIAVIAVIPIFFIWGLINSKQSSHYPIIIVSVAIALLLSFTLMTNYMYGDDIHSEFNVFSTTKSLSYWNPLHYNSYEQFGAISMLSVTILPTVLSNMLNIEPGWVFKILLPLVFALVPVGLYQLYKIQWGKKVAFISVFFFMANAIYFQLLPTNVECMIAELFFVLMFLIIFGEGGNYGIGKGLSIIFLSFGLVVSHYGIDYIFLFLILLTWLFGKLFLKNQFAKIKSTAVAFPLLLTFLWYTRIAQGPFDKIVGNFQTAFLNFQKEFFDFSSRGQPIQTALSLIAPASALHGAGIILHDITTGLILVGFVSIIFVWKKEKLNSEYVVITLLSTAILFAAVIIPLFAGFLEVDRLYQILLIFLSPLFVLGAKTLLTIIPGLRKRKEGGK